MIFLHLNIDTNQLGHVKFLFLALLEFFVDYKDILSWQKKNAVILYLEWETRIQAGSPILKCLDAVGTMVAKWLMLHLMGAGQLPLWEKGTFVPFPRVRAQANRPP